MEAIVARRSVRAFQDMPVPEYVIQDMLGAARLVPSGGNGQTYRFGIIDDPAVIRELAQAAGGQMWVAGAPLVVACCADISWDIGAVPRDDFAYIVNVLRFGQDMIDHLNEFPDRRAVGRLLGNATPLMAAEHMLLTAVSHGLQGCFVGYLDVQRAGEVLGLPDYVACLFLLPIGYPAQDPPEKPKLSVGQISFRNRWP